MPLPRILPPARSSAPHSSQFTPSRPTHRDALHLRGTRIKLKLKLKLKPKLKSCMQRSKHSPNMSSIATTRSLDHLVLTVKDLDATIQFYEKVLGMQSESFATASSPETKRYALKFGTQKINLHVCGKEFEPKAQFVQPGSADLCFLVQDNVHDVLKGLQAEGIDVLEGGQVVDRTGAQGKIRSVYCRDPDGNLIELSNLC